MVLIRRIASYWRYYAALGGVVLIVLIAGKAERGSYSQSPTQHHSAAPKSSSTSSVGYPGPDYANACAKTEAGGDQSLCINRESLKAYKKQAFWAQAAVWVGTAGTLAVLASLLWTIKAVRAAERSADAAIASVKASREVGQAQIRAYVNVAGVRIAIKRITVDGMHSGDFPEIEITARNSGNSTALKFRYRTELALSGDINARIQKTILPEEVGRDIPSGATVAVKRQLLNTVFNKYNSIMFFEGDLQIVCTIFFVYKRCLWTRDSRYHKFQWKTALR